MNARILLPLSSVLFLGIGVFAGFLAFHQAPGDELVIEPKRAPGEEAGEARREEEVTSPNAPDASTEKLIEKLRAENAELTAKVANLEADRKANPSPKAGPAKSGGSRDSGYPSPALPGVPPPIPVDRNSRANPAELADGKGGIEGYFIHTDDRPGKNVPVTVMKQSGEFNQYNTRTDATGHYVKLDLSPGRYHITSGFMPKTDCKWPSRFVKVEAGKITRVDVGSTENITVKGRAFTAEGRPASSAFVLLMHFDSNGDSDMRSYSAMTDDEGRFSFLNLRPTSYQWNLQGMDRVSYGTGRIEFTRAGPFEWDLRPAGLKLSGRVVNSETGRPVRDASVSVHRQGGDQSPGSHASTDGDGRFQFQGLAPGTYRVHTYADGYVMDEKVSMDLVQPLEIALDPAAVFKVRVTDEAGAPITEVDVVLWATDEKGKKHYWPLHFLEGETGEIDHAPPGRYDVKVQAKGYESVTRDGILLSKGDNPSLEFVLRKQ